MNESEMHMFAGIGTALVTALLVVPGVVLGGGGNARAESSVPDDLMVIEASLAYKSTKTVQPQKKKRAAIKDVKQGVAKDLTKEPPPPDPDKPPPPPKGMVPDDKEPVRDLSPSDDLTAGIGDPTEEPVGDFNGDEYGFDTITSGDPYFQKLKGDLIRGWEYPAILDDGGIPIGCLQLKADGTVPQIEMKALSKIAELDDSVERQLKKLQDMRNDKPEPVPTNLLSKATTRWICFKFNPKGT